MSQTITVPNTVADLTISRKPNSVGLVGLGYVGLPTALSMLNAGRPVIGYDISQRRIDAIQECNVDLLPEDSERLKKNLTNPNLRLSSDVRELSDADGIIVCVPTPITTDFAPDLSILKSACEDVVAAARTGQVIILTSTTYIGCTRDFLVDSLLERGLVPGKDVHIAFSPERIDPGVPDHRPETTPRVVGGYTPECVEAAKKTLQGSAPVFHEVSSLEAAEMCKLLENTYRAVNISMINEFAEAAQTLDVNITEVIDAASTKPYGFQKFTPGPGVGGHCIPCDPHYLLWQLRRDRMSSPVVEAAMLGIAKRPLQVVRRIEEELLKQGVRLEDAIVHIHGIAYKPNVADFRESPAEPIIDALMQRGIKVEYSDHLIDAVTIGGQEMTSTSVADSQAHVALVHTVHDGAVADWDNFKGQVLDATYKLSPGDNIAFV